MIHLPASVRVYLATAPCDMRRSFDGLHALVSAVLRLDAFAGHLFVFAGSDQFVALAAGAAGVKRTRIGVSRRVSAMQPLQPHSISTSRKIDFERTIRRTKKPPACAGGFGQSAKKVLIGLP